MIRIHGQSGMAAQTPAAKRNPVAQPSAATVRNHPVVSARPVAPVTVTRAEVDALMARVAELEKASTTKPAKRDRAAYHREYRKRPK